MCQFYTRFGNLDTTESHRKTNVCIKDKYPCQGQPQGSNNLMTAVTRFRMQTNANNLKHLQNVTDQIFLLVIIYVKFHLQCNPVASEGDYFLFSPYNITPKLNI